jgi:Macrocin-O-methyltransferase (TylF)
MYKSSEVKPNQSKSNNLFFDEQERYYTESVGDNVLKLENFTKYASRETITRFLARNEVFKKQIGVHGSILDFGVRRGASLMTWAHLSSIYEPVNYTREIVGFDTFEGFPEIDSNKDIGSCEEIISKGSLSVESGMKEDIYRSIALHDSTRFLGHMEKVRLVEGDILETLPKFLDDNRHMVVSLLHIDVDIYAPTKCILENVLPRMPKGSVILFDEVNMKVFPGETIAVLETIGIKNLKINRFDFCPNISYAILD